MAQCSLIFGLISSVFEYLFKSLSVITKLCDKDQFLGFPLNKIWYVARFVCVYILFVKVYLLIFVS